MQYDTGPVLPLPLNADQSFALQNIFPQGSPHTVTVSVTDRFGQSDTETSRVEVMNVAPAVQRGPDVAIRPGARRSRGRSRFTDPGADTWTAQVNFGDGTVQTFGALTQHQFDITHSYATRAVRTVTVTVSDGEAAGTDQFVVSPPNVAPVLAAIPDQSVVLTHTLQLTASATDVDAPPQTLAFSLLPGAPAGATIDPASGIFRWTPGLTAGPGTRAVTVRVTDNGDPALVDEKTFTLTVLPNLDADGSGAAGPTDGVLIVRYLSGTPDAQLLAGVTLDSGATRTTAAAIRSYLDTGRALAPRMLDADGNGQITLLTDGRLISRYLAGATGTALIGGSAVGAGATRTTAAAIAAYLDGFRPAAPVVPQSAELGPADATSPSVAVTSPAQGAWVSPGTVVVELAAQNFVLGGQGETHLNFYLDADPTPYVFLNGATREVLYQGVHTHFVHWHSETSIELHGLPSGPHTIRFVLADAAGQELDESGGHPDPQPDRRRAARRNVHPGAGLHGAELPRLVRVRPGWPALLQRVHDGADSRDWNRRPARGRTVRSAAHHGLQRGGPHRAGAGSRLRDQPLRVRVSLVPGWQRHPEPCRPPDRQQWGRREPDDPDRQHSGLEFPQRRHPRFGPTASST